MISEGLEAQITLAREALIARGGRFVDLPTLVPASLVLEMAGEGLRPRLFFTTAPDGSEMCLRADLTIPAALEYIAQATTDLGPVAWGCHGPVFRAPRNGDDRAPEFLQIGLERYGDDDIGETDVAVFLAAWSACQSAAVQPLLVRFCDGGLLRTIISLADLPDVWRGALLEQAGHTRALLSILSQASAQAPARSLSDWEAQLADLPFDQARDLVAAHLERDDLSLAAKRSLDDVTSRLIARIRRTKARKLSPETAQILSDLAQFKGGENLADNLDTIVALAARIQVDLSQWRTFWDRRLAAIGREAPAALSLARFEAIGEEAFDYYDGMAFDISATPDFNRPVATGGRYDRLIGEISGGKRHATAIGCVIRPDRFGGTDA